MLVASATLEPRPRLLTVLLERPNIIEAIRECIRHGVYEGMRAESESAWYPKNGPGMFSYLFCCRYLGEKLNEFGFDRNEVQNQLRFIGPPSSSQRIRLTLCRGDFQGNIAEVHTKGPITRQLIEENAPYDPQGILFTQEELDGGHFINIWILIAMSVHKRLTTQVAVMGMMNDQGNNLISWDQELIDSYDMNLYEPKSQVLPEGVVPTVVIQERNLKGGTGL